MGKSLVIKGADFSANGIQEEITIDITATVAASPNFHARGRLNGSLYAGPYYVEDSKRCCLVPTLFTDLNVDISQFSQMVITLKDGYDYIIGTGTAPGSAPGWQSWAGSQGGGGYEWVTDGSKVVTVTLDATTLAMSMNLRYHVDADFPQSTVLTDIIQSIVLN